MMRIFNKKENKKEKTKLELFINSISKFEASEEVINSAILMCKKVINGEIDNPFYTEENLIVVIANCLNNNKEINLNIDGYFNRMKTLFNSVYVEGVNSDFTYFDRFVNMFSTNGIIDSDLFDITFYRLFDNSKYFYILMETVEFDRNLRTNFSKIISFLISIRGSYVSEESFYHDTLDFMNKVKYGANTDYLINEAKSRIDRKSGIYNFDETLLDMLCEKSLSAEGTLGELTKSIEEASKTLSSLKERLFSYAGSLSRIEEESLQRYSTSLEKDLIRLRESVDKSKEELKKYELLQKEDITKNLIGFQEKILRELNDEKTRILSSLKTAEETLLSLALTKTSEIVRTGNEQLSSLDSFVTNHPHLKELINEMVPSRENIELIMNLSSKLDKIKESKEMSGSLVFPSPNVIVQSEEVDPTINPYFDETRSFESRLEELEEKMERNSKERGIIYHKKTLSIVKALMEHFNPYLYGPSGSGKTYLVSLIADLLGIEMLNNGYINEEYQVIGVEPFMGNWKPTPTYTSYKYGRLLFIDEIDNGVGRANVILNPFLNPSEKSYIFTNSERVLRHPNFRVITAANTDGSGATRTHSTREKIEGTVDRRLKLKYFIDYDENVEKTILEDYKDLYNFILMYRKALRNWESSSGEITIKDMITTSDIADIKRVLDHKSFSMSDIISMEFIGAKNYQYLNEIYDYMDSYYSSNGTEEEREIFNIFKGEVKKYKFERGFND